MSLWENVSNSAAVSSFAVNKNNAATPAFAAAVASTTTTSSPTVGSMGSAGPSESNNMESIELNSVEVNIYENLPKVKSIHLDGLVVLQIIKHCHQSLPQCVAGSLLGLEDVKNNVLEITNSFPTPHQASDDPDEQDDDEYQIEMMNNLREVNMDNNKVGWYQSCLQGSFINISVIENQFQYQEMLGPNAVCLVYDPSQTTKGSLFLKAFRLTSSFYDQYKTRSFTKENFEKYDIRSNTILEEIPIKLHNSDIINCWLMQIRKQEFSKSDFDRLDLGTSAYLEENIELLCSWADELAFENQKLHNYERAQARQLSQQNQWLQKRKEENKIRQKSGQEPLTEDPSSQFKPLSQPSRLESLLISKQINIYCDQIKKFTGKGCKKLFFAGGLHKE